MIRVHGLVRRLSICVLVSTLSACIAPAGDIESDRDVGVESSALRSLDTEEAEFLRLMNAHRAANGVAPLVVSTRLLNQVAYDHSLDMAANNYFSHTNLAGKSPFDRMREAGYTGGWMAENIAAGNASAAGTFEQWKNSSGHNTNMLNPRYKAVGIGRAYVAGSTYRYYWTNVFGDAIDASGDGGQPGEPEQPGDGEPGDGEPEEPEEPACASSESEPNNSASAADALSGTLCGQTAAGDSDWFAFRPTSGSVFTLSASQGATLTLQYVSRNRWVSVPVANGQASATANGRTYYARVTGSAVSDYTLTLR